LIAKQVFLTAWATPPVHFALVILELDLANCSSRLAMNSDPPVVCTSQVGPKKVHETSSFVWMKKS
jgi:hypothetical protein